jgi:hypothetical protein
MKDQTKRKSKILKDAAGKQKPEEGIACLVKFAGLVEFENAEDLGYKTSYNLAETILIYLHGIGLLPMKFVLTRSYMGRHEVEESWK